MKRKFATGSGTILLLALLAATVWGHSHEFYRGKTVRILIGASAGGEELHKIVDRLFSLKPAVATRLKEVLK